MSGLYMAIGDSITFGSIGVARGKGEHYAHKVHRLMLSNGIKVKFSNVGVHGTNSTNLLATSHHLGTSDADIITIMIGMNDATAAISQATFQSNVEGIIDNIKAGMRKGLGKIYLCTINKRGDAVDVSPYNATLQTVATNKGVTLIDTNSAFTTTAGNLFDTVHPNPTGAILIANKIWDTLKTENLAKLIARLV